MCLHTVFLRFLAGVGLAGEVGAAITIAAEITPLPYRGFGTAAVATMGFLGSILASFCGGILPWRIAFITAGLAGLLLLFGRMKVAETGLFLKLDKSGETSLARLLLLFREGRALRVGRCILCGVPFWFGAGLLVSCAPAICKGGMVSVATVALVYTIGQALGNIACGFLSQRLRSRKKAILIFLFADMISSGLLLLCGNTTYVYLSGLTGFCMGSFAMLLTTTAEQFGTNLRSTVSSIVPNAVRASVMPITFAFIALDSFMGSTGSALLTGLCCFLLAILATVTMDETFGRDLSFVE